MTMKIKYFFNFFCGSLLILSFLLFGCEYANAAFDVKTFNIQQTYFTKDVNNNRYLRGYMELMNNYGNPLQSVDVEQFKATFGDEVLPLKELRSFSSAGEGVGTVFMIDTSLSLSPFQFRAIQNALLTWVDSMTAEEQVAIVIFGDEVNVLTEFTNDRERLKSLILTITQTRKETRLNDGIVQAFKTANINKPGLPPRRLIIGLSDGINEATAGFSREEVIKEIEKNKVPLYFVAYSKAKTTASERIKYAAGLEEMGIFCRVSGGSLYKDGHLSFSDTYANIHKRIWNAFIFSLDVSALKGDGNLHHLQLQFTQDGSTTRAETDVRFVADESAQKNNTTVIYGVLGAIVLLALVFAILRTKKKNQKKIINENENTNLGKPLTTVAANQKSVVKSDGFILEFAIVGDKSGKKHSISVTDRATIGRSKDCNLSFTDDPSISGKHCEISVSSGIIYIRDLNSTNGTNVNGVPISNLFKLKIGDIITIGKQQLRLADVKAV
jgi:hypothetical protein